MTLSLKSNPKIIFFAKKSPIPTRSRKNMLGVLGIYSHFLAARNGIFCHFLGGRVFDHVFIPSVENHGTYHGFSHEIWRCPYRFSLQMIGKWLVNVWQMFPCSPAILKNSVGVPFDSHVQNPRVPHVPHVPFRSRCCEGPEVSAAAVLPERTCPVIVRAIMLILVAWRWNVRPPRYVCWFRFAPVTMLINTINHSCWSYVHQLSYRTGASHCSYIWKMTHLFIDGLPLK